MRLMIKLALCAVMPWFIGGAAGYAQASNRSDGALLSPQQGKALVDFALQHDGWRGHKPDCSHLVHKIYNLAGLKYPYTDSRDLYWGAESFVRVSRPQPGDLIVWLGHVGIVVSPAHRTFFSSVRSGILTEPWTTASWKRRGRPRFFRYRIGPATDQTLLANLMPPQPERGDLSVSNQSMNEAYLPSGRQASGPLTVAPSVPPSQYSEERTLSPRFVAIIRGRARPSRQDIGDALAEGSDTRARKLIAGELFDLEHPVSVVDRIEVNKVKIKHGKGYIILKLNEDLSLADGKIITGKSVKRRLGLYRRNGDWVITDPRQRLYLPQDQALSIFERQAELFLHQAPAEKIPESLSKR